MDFNQIVNMTKATSKFYYNFQRVLTFKSNQLLTIRFSPMQGIYWKSFFVCFL